MNYFLISESILLAVVGMLAGKPMATKPLLLSIVALGMILTFVWMYIQGKQRYILTILKGRCEAVMPEYRLSHDLRGARRWKISNGWLLAYFVPTVIAVVWVIVFCAIFVS